MDVYKQSSNTPSATQNPFFCGRRHVVASLRSVWVKENIVNQREKFNHKLKLICKKLEQTDQQVRKEFETTSSGDMNTNNY